MFHFWMKLILIFSYLLLPTFLVAKTVKYNLVASKAAVNLSGKKTVDWALHINGSIPAPVLIFNEGDTAEITVKNTLEKEELSIHWHGILLPPEMDGVSYVNTPPIKAGTSFTFRFTLRQHGTYWYHSHTALQEQKGLYGAIIIHPKVAEEKYDQDLAVVLSDWSDENPDAIMRNLRKDGDYYLYKKGTLRSWWGAIQADALGQLLHDEWIRMGGMDLSDVGYDAFLINGKKESQLASARPGEKIRLRLVNAGASSYFYVSLGGLPFQVIAADGINIEPRWTEELLMGMAETYDIVFSPPDSKNYELRATAQDVTGFASAWINAGNGSELGRGEKVPAKSKAAPNLYAAMNHGSSVDHGANADHGAAGDHSVHAENVKKNDAADHSEHRDHSEHSEHADHETTTKAPQDVLPQVNITHLKSKSPTAFTSSIPRYDIKLVLGGDMERYIWHINGAAIYQDRNIEIREGDVIRMTFVNDTMMHHPMHLHGHFFRVLNSFADHAPLKHTVDVAPHSTQVIEFLANEPGEWMLHCHNLYHMKTGMARVVKYSSFAPNPELAKIQAQDPHLHDHIYHDGRIELASHLAKANFRLSQTWLNYELDYEMVGYNHDEIDQDLSFFARRWIDNYASFAVGALHKNPWDDKAETRGAVAFAYILPLLIESQLTLDHKGDVGLHLEKKFQWTSDVYTELAGHFYEKFTPKMSVSLVYAPSWSWGLSTSYVHDLWGAGAFYRF